MERTDEDRLAGILRIAVGGTVKAVPTLKLGQIEEWAQRPRHAHRFDRAAGSRMDDAGA